LLLFIASLLLTMAASAWFTRRLETICDSLSLPPSLLSLLGALGANIPNYAASTLAIAGGHLDVGLGIIIGSNVYNIAIILSLAIFATPKKHGIVLTLKQAQDARSVARYTLAIILTISLAMWLLPGTPLTAALLPPLPAAALLMATALLALAIFAALALHALRRVHDPHSTIPTGPTGNEKQAGNAPRLSLMIVEALVALMIALAGVFVMVQSGQDLTRELGIPAVLAGLLVLAVATSLPNTVVAFSLARTDRETACVEEIFSSNSINAALGIALPLLFWHFVLRDRLLLFLDAPLMVLLTLGALAGVLRRRLGRAVGLLLLLVYAAWIAAHVLF
jgi:cation:H+ antiporter